MPGIGNQFSSGPNSSAEVFKDRPVLTTGGKRNGQRVQPKVLAKVESMIEWGGLNEYGWIRDNPHKTGKNHFREAKVVGSGDGMC